jgi:hypothetical protein
MAAFPVLRAHRRGRWQAWSAAALQADVAALAAGWQALGVRAGDRVGAVGPLGAPFVLSLLALRALGAQLVPGGPLRHVLVDSSHALEALRACQAEAGTVVLAHGLPGAAPAGAVPFGTLFQHGACTVDLEIDTNRTGDRASVIAEFDPAWTPGLSRLLSDWLPRGAVLHLPEPGGDAWADRRTAAPREWWADAPTLARAADELDARLPAAPLSSWARWRAQRVLGLSSGLRYTGDAQLPAAARAVFDRLGWVDAAEPLLPAGAAFAAGVA